MFEVDYEANMALFLVAHFTEGSSSAQRSRFSGALRERLQWSRVYRDLLDSCALLYLASTWPHATPLSLKVNYSS